MSEPAPEGERRIEAAVVAAVAQTLGMPCPGCRRAICGHEVVMSWVLGFKDAPRCLDCLAAGLEKPRDELAQNLRSHIEHRDCWSAGWRRASELEGLAADAPPACLARADASFDAGDMGCGDLVLELRLRLKAMRPRQTLALVARDPGAPEDLPAWCGLTGHALLAANHPNYLIRRKEE